MALQRNTEYPGRFDDPSTGQPQGGFRNKSTDTSTDGSYLESKWLNDWSAFFSSLLEHANITPNGDVDSVGASQYFDALQYAITPIGVPHVWLTDTPPDGFAIMKGQAFDTATYTKLATIFPDGILPDMRGDTFVAKEDLETVNVREDGEVKSHTHTTESTRFALDSTSISNNNSKFSAYTFQTGSPIGAFTGVADTGAVNLSQGSVNNLNLVRFVLSLQNNLSGYTESKSINVNSNNTANSKNTINHRKCNYIVRLG